jgi:hypothetical protein
LITLRWSEQRGQYESLATAMRALHHGAGPSASYEELLATLGLGLLVTAADDEAPELWSFLGRDCALMEAAELYGMRLRALHPPPAARGLRRSAEFSAHFHDSYLPLIRQALAHDQPALAWRGWPAPCEHCWGVLTDVDETPHGYVLGCRGVKAALPAAAHQVYLVEEIAPQEAGARSPAALFQQAVDAARRSWCASDAGAGVLYGSDAWARWQALLNIPCPDEARSAAAHATRDQARCEAPEHPLAQAAKTLAAARDSMANWLTRVQPRLEPETQSAAAVWARACRASAAILKELARVGRELLRSAEGRCSAAARVAEVARIEQEAMSSVSQVGECEAGGALGRAVDA